MKHKSTVDKTMDNRAQTIDKPWKQAKAIDKAMNDRAETIDNRIKNRDNTMKKRTQ